MSWTRTLPTHPGYYWNRSATVNEEPHVYYVGPMRDGVMHVFYDRENEPVSEWGGEWSGPLKVPTGTCTPDFLWQRNPDTGDMENYSTYAARRDGHTAPPE